MNFDFLKYINFSTIISEIKKSRNGVLLIAFLICIANGLFDFLVLRRYNIKLDFYTSFYLIAGSTAFFVWSAKVYNRIADKADEKREKAEKEKAEKQKIDNYCRQLENLSVSEKELLRRFISEKTLNILCCKNEKDLDTAKCINVRFWRTEINGTLTNFNETPM